MLPPRTEGDFQASDRIARPPPLDSKRPSDFVLLKTSFFELIFDFNFHMLMSRRLKQGCAAAGTLHMTSS
jgi:hypothetical protein